MWKIISTVSDLREFEHAIISNNCDRCGEEWMFTNNPELEEQFPTLGSRRGRSRRAQNAGAVGPQSVYCLDCDRLPDGRSWQLRYDILGHDGLPSFRLDLLKKRQQKKLYKILKEDGKFLRWMQFR